MADDWLNDSSGEENDTWGAQADAKRMHEEFMTAGAREGVDAGREATIQAGFDAGFSTASQAMQIIQCCRAILSCVSGGAEAEQLMLQLQAAQDALMQLPPPVQAHAQDAGVQQAAQHADLVQRITAVRQHVLALLPQAQAPAASGAAEQALA